MRLPGFNASSSLYRTSSHYGIAVGGNNDPATIGIQPLAVSPVASPRQLLPEVIQPFPHVLCQPCSVDQSGQCTKYCVFCPDPFPDERCRASFLPCSASECCPAGQEPCYVGGTNKFCCPPGQTCCDPETHFCCPLWHSCCDAESKLCCPPFQSCCFDVCCPTGTDCCGSLCCPTGQCCNGVCCPTGQSCCNGLCCPTGQCCSGACCPTGPCCNDVCCTPEQTCFNGCCATNTSGLTLSSNSNFLLINGNCQNMKDLKVSLNITQDMVAAVTPSGGGTATQNGGFDLQLNAYNPAGPTTSWMQYIFLISSNEINYQVQYWDPTAACGCGHTVCDCTGPLVNLNGTVLSLSSNTIPAGYVLEIALNNDSTGNITGATFSVTDNNGTTNSKTATLDANHQFPIVAFEANVVGPDNASNSQFSSGAGTITYEISNGQLCVEGGLPDASCNTPGSKLVHTAETSNVTYGPIGPPCCAAALTQSVSSPSQPPPPTPCCPPRRPMCCGVCRPRQPAGTGSICDGTCIGRGEQCP